MDTSQLNKFHFVCIVLHVIESLAVEQYFQNDAPPYWNRVNDRVEDFPVKNGKFVIDPWNYLERQALYKIMLKETENVMKEFGPNNSGNILWGLPLQHGWQQASKRLKSFNKHDWNCHSSWYIQRDMFCISVSSWWGSMNYYLGVVPFLGALESGLLNYTSSDINILKPQLWYPANSIRDGTLYSCVVKTGEKYCVSKDECDHVAPRAMDKWIKFFEILQQCNNKLNMTINESRLKSCNLSEDQLLKYMWEAHIASINAALLMFKDWLSYMPKPEQDFGIGWSNIVGYVASSRFATNYNNTLQFQTKLLPSRILMEGDYPPYIHDLSPEVNQALFLLQVAQKLDQTSEGWSGWLWRRMMCSAEGRNVGHALMRDFLNFPQAFLDILKLAWVALTQSCTY